MQSGNGDLSTARQSVAIPSGVRVLALLLLAGSGLSAEDATQAG